MGNLQSIILECINKLCHDNDDTGHETITINEDCNCCISYYIDDPYLFNNDKG